MNDDKMHQNCSIFYSEILWGAPLYLGRKKKTFLL